MLRYDLRHEGGIKASPGQVYWALTPGIRSPRRDR